MDFRYRFRILLHVFAAIACSCGIAGVSQAQDDDPPFSTSDTNVGYIDSAIPATQIRFRFDSAYGNPTPDRAEFFYRASTAATGLPISPAETGVDYQEVWTSLEWSPSPMWSISLDVPFRFINPELNPNREGFSDIQISAKGVLWMDSDQALTAQLRAYLPTGDADRLLGTDHVSLEPALLYAARLNSATLWENELRLWIPIDGTEIAGENFAGPILRYGTGVGVDLYQASDHCCGTRERLTAVAEFVGWTILDGLATVPQNSSTAQLISVDGDTTLNAKLGLRWTEPKHSLFMGYGRSLTGDVWYHDILRAEYAFRF